MPDPLTPEQREEIYGACWQNGFANPARIAAFIEAKVREEK